MKLKRVLTVVLLVFAAGSVTYMISTEKKAESTDIKPHNSAVPASDQLIVYYFHNSIRCPTCYKLETYTKEALETFFAEQLANEQIRWKIVNVDISGNEHFIKDYRLATKSVVLSDVADGKEVGWKNLDQIWQKVKDKDNYLQYIRDSIIEFLEQERR